ncbi:MAG TPA: DUF4129 domain-containing protein [Micromonosporaceae bacterium]
MASLLTVAAIAASRSSLQVREVQPIGGSPEPMDRLPPQHYETSAPPQLPTSDAGNLPLPGWAGTLLAIACGALAAAVIGLLLIVLFRDRASRRRRLPQEVGAEVRRTRTADEVVAALDAGLADLSDSDTDPRRAVIACWVRLERAAADAGVPRQVGDTPTDLVTRLLTGRSASTGDRPAVVSADVLEAFAQTYREARYASHTVDERMRAQARAALARLRVELSGSA